MAPGDGFNSVQSPMLYIRKEDGTFEEAHMEGVQTGIDSEGNPIYAVRSAFTDEKGNIKDPLSSSDILQPKRVIFHNAETAATADGQIIDISGYSGLLLVISGTTTSGTVAFKTKDDVNDAYLDELGIKKDSSHTEASSVTISSAPHERWQFDIAGLDSMKCPITLANGNITVIGWLLP